MAQIHKDAFVLERPWTAEEFDNLAAQSNIKILSVADCFVFGRLTLDELEILTVACSPSEQRQGYAFMLMMELLSLTKKELLLHKHSELSYQLISELIKKGEILNTSEKDNRELLKNLLNRKYVKFSINIMSKNVFM